MNIFPININPNDIEELDGYEYIAAYFPIFCSSVFFILFKSPSMSFTISSHFTAIGFILF